jgi:hypothetical protein
VRFIIGCAANEILHFKIYPRNIQRNAAGSTVNIMEGFRWTQATTGLESIVFKLTPNNGATTYNYVPNPIEIFKQSSAIALTSTESSFSDASTLSLSSLTQSEMNILTINI